MCIICILQNIWVTGFPRKHREPSLNFILEGSGSRLRYDFTHTNHVMYVGERVSSSTPPIFTKASYALWWLGKLCRQSVAYVGFFLQGRCFTVGCRPWCHASPEIVVWVGGGGGGGAQKIMLADIHHECEARGPLWLGSRARLRALLPPYVTEKRSIYTVVELKKKIWHFVIFVFIAQYRKKSVTLKNYFVVLLLYSAWLSNYTLYISIVLW